MSQLPAGESTRSLRFPGAVAVVREGTVRVPSILNAIVDGVLLWAAFWIAYELRYRYEVGGVVFWFDQQSFAAFYGRAAIFAGITMLILLARGAYRMPAWSSLYDEMSVVAGSITIAMGAVVLTAFLSRFAPSRLVFVYAWAAAIVLLLLARIVRNTVRTALWNRDIGVQRVLIVGSGTAGRRLMQTLLSKPGMGIRIAGYVDDPSDPGTLEVGSERGVVRARRLGSLSDLPAVLNRNRVNEVILALPVDGHATALEMADWCRSAGVPFKVVPDLLQLSLDRVHLDEISGVPLLSVREASIQGFNQIAKRSTDLLLGVILAVGFAIPMAAIALWIRADSKGPILFRQTRIGRGGVPFNIWKFRCMRVDADGSRGELIARHTDRDPKLFKLENDPRLTDPGRTLRRWSLDELPQLFNVFRGEMSLVGPRPQLPSEVAQYEDWHRQRLMVTPGIAGLWQVNGRSDLTFDEMVRLDLFYAEHWSLWLDFKILMRTVPAVLLGRGAY